MSSRFVYDLMKAGEFFEHLDRLQITVEDFCMFTGVNPRTTERWRDQPHHELPFWIVSWVELVSLRGGMSVCRDVAALGIREDRARPEAGPYPFDEQRKRVKEAANA